MDSSLWLSDENRAYRTALGVTPLFLNRSTTVICFHSLSYVPGLRCQFSENLRKDKSKVHILIFTGNIQNFPGWFNARRIQITFADGIDQHDYNFFSYLLRAMGNSVVPLSFLAVSAGMNIVLDIWFVVGLHMGVSGAAWATVIAQAAAGIGIAVYSIAKLPILHRDRPSVKWNPHRLWEIIVNDVATGIQQSVMNFGILMIQGLVNSFGTTIMASFAAAVKIDTIAYMPAQEFGNAYSLFVSQNYGAKKAERIRKGTHISFLASAAFCNLQRNANQCVFGIDEIAVTFLPSSLKSGIIIPSR